MTIRDATEADLETLANIWEAAVRATHDFLSEPDIQCLRPKVRDVYLYAMTLRVHVDARKSITGFIGVAQDKVEMLFLDPTARGRGIGKKLLTHAITEMGATTVDVNEQNAQAIGFYLHLGCTVVDRSPLDGQGRPFPLLHLRLPHTA